MWGAARDGRRAQPITIGGTTTHKALGKQLQRQSRRQYCCLWVAVATATPTASDIAIHPSCRHLYSPERPRLSFIVGDQITSPKKNRCISATGAAPATIKRSTLKAGRNHTFRCTTACDRWRGVGFVVPNTQKMKQFFFCLACAQYLLSNN